MLTLESIPANLPVLWLTTLIMDQPTTTHPTHGNGYHAENNYLDDGRKGSRKSDEDGMVLQFEDERLTAVISWLSGASSTMNIASTHFHSSNGGIDGSIIHPPTLSLPLASDTNGHAVNGHGGLLSTGCSSMKLFPRDDMGLVMLSAPSATARRSVIEAFFSSLPMLPQRLYAARKQVVS